MKKFFLSLGVAAMLLSIQSCDSSAPKDAIDATVITPAKSFEYKADEFADVSILRYNVPGFEALTAQQKAFVYYLSQAALSGRDMIYDQNYKHNLLVRKTLESLLASKLVDDNTPDGKGLLIYAKRVFFSNGIHHHYSSDKLIPACDAAYFEALIAKVDPASLPLNGLSVADFTKKISKIVFDPKFDSKRVSRDSNTDLVTSSAMNMYGEGVTQQEVEDFYRNKVDRNNPRPVAHGLNSKLIKKNGKVVEDTYKVGGLYTEALEKVVFWLEKAKSVAENEGQQKWLSLLIDFYKTGDLKTFDDFSVAWTNTTEGDVDMIHGFIEVYGDPMSYRGAYESIIEIKDPEASKRMAALAQYAQWFEDHSPIAKAHKKDKVVGISYKVVNAVMEAGDAAPSTPVGVNLPNSNWIRKEYGSKAVSLGNIKNAYEEAAGPGMLDEFAWTEAEKERAIKYGTLSNNMRTALHEVVGHASGQLEAGVGTPKETLKNYANALEESRADLVALYYLMDQKLVDIGVIPNLEVGKAAYDAFIRNGMMLQLRRLEEGAIIEQAHMRNRAMIAHWLFEKGQQDKVITREQRDGKTFFVINDYSKMRTLLGTLLKEVQRIKSQGDYEAGKALIENYGVQVDAEIRAEVIKRYEPIGSKPYGGFIQPSLTPVMDGDKIVDVKISYPSDFVQQMLHYGKEYAFLPAK
ncbi:dipeptidyl-peptidase 3 family protein [Persicobacter psychrovividus]|uniref:Dihydrofolate reductase n=1 Tax=Persicobacter psychrovividus TaxID=387638 RepID=A0ABM7VE96_9BACT|nr:dihydrofolate reductase [Persicobacter psychrovividus]